VVKTSEGLRIYNCSRKGTEGTEKGGGDLHIRRIGLWVGAGVIVALFKGAMQKEKKKDGSGM